MEFDANTLKRIRDYAALGHTPGQIVSLLGIAYQQREAFLDEFSRSDTKVYQSFMQGKAMMDYNVNVELTRNAEKGDTEAIEVLDQRKQNQKVAELLSDLFGV